MKANTSRVHLSLYLVLSVPTFLSGCEVNATEAKLPRNQPLRLFDPHMKSFECRVEAQSLPSLDPEADAWFRESRKLESPDIYVSDRDYPRIVQLTRQAAERHHWKAMLNLASYYVEGRDPQHGNEDAVRLIEAAMQLNVPAAYDRMGTYHMNGVGVSPDATRAYAFWQHAALMGNPQALTYIGRRLRAIDDNIIPGYWANIPVATKMLECAHSQGYGPAAYELYSVYLRPLSSDGTYVMDPTAETRTRTMRLLHEGVKFGCSNCAIKLYLEFDPARKSPMFAPFVDKARTERYRILARALEFNPDLCFPNLDQVLPLPPATIPKWDGDQDTLLEAAQGVSHPPEPEKPAATPPTKDRHALDGTFKLQPGSEQISDVRAPFAAIGSRRRRANCEVCDEA